MRKIRLFCAAGMSTSLLVTKMRKAADEMGYECEINAYPVSQVDELGPEADIVLLGPQVRFQLKDVKAKLPNNRVEVIEMMDYGMANGKKILAHVKDVLGD